MSKEFTIKSDGSADDLRYSDGNPASDAELGDSESLKDLQRNPFLDPKVEAYWRQIYEQAQYECRHEFDPHAQWTPKEEKKLVRKLDLRITTWACIMFFALNMDRKNLPSALAGNLLPQLGLTTNDYNYGMLSNTLSGGKLILDRPNNILGIIFARRSAFTINLQTNWPRSMDSNSNGSLVNSCNGSGRPQWKGNILCVSSIARSS